MPGKKNMRGGNANVRPIEYYGGNSGRYFENPAPSSSDFAYGKYHPVSFGVIDPVNNTSGPNMGVFNVGSEGSNYTQQTGGRRVKRSKRKSQRQRAGCISCGCRPMPKNNRKRNNRKGSNKKPRRTNKKGNNKKSKNSRRRSRKSSRN